MKKQTFITALMCLAITCAILSGCANTQTEPPELPSSDVTESSSPSIVPTPETTGSEEPELPVTMSICGTWLYSHSTEGDEETPLSLYEFTVSPPYLEILEDNTISAHYYESVRGGMLVQTSPNEYTVTDITVNAEGSEYHEDLDDYISYNPDSGELRYTLSIADVHHYFTLAAD